MTVVFILVSLGEHKGFPRGFCGPLFSLYSSKTRTYDLEARPWARCFLPDSAYLGSSEAVNRWEQSPCDTSGVKRRNRGGRQTKERAEEREDT